MEVSSIKQSSTEMVREQFASREVSEELIEELVNFIVTSDQRDLLNYYYTKKFAINQSPKNVAVLFNGLLDGKIKQVQNFTEKGAHRRVYAKPITKGEDPVYRTFVRNKDGREEEWNINYDNLNKGYWVEIPEEKDYVSFGIALDALTTNRCDLIRCEDWEDQNQYLRLKQKTIHYPNGYLVCLNNGHSFQPSMQSMTSKRWIMLKFMSTKGH